MVSEVNTAGKGKAGHVSSIAVRRHRTALQSGVALGGLVIREFHAESSTAERIAMHVVVSAVGDLSLVVLDDD